MEEAEAKPSMAEGHPEHEAEPKLAMVDERPEEGELEETANPAPVEATEPTKPDTSSHNGRFSVPRERCKSAVVTLLVFGSLAAVIGILTSLAANFEEPDCPVRQESVCEECGRILNFAPYFGEWENSWKPKWPRAIMYFLSLVWAFMGMGIVCDQFMSAIEEITSAETVVWVEIHSGTRRKFHKRVWNATVANLTLMALGSSAPEILLTATELWGSGFYAGKLGPSTIVGSAAFNLLVISAVCISAIPDNEVRKVEMTDVFGTTTTVSIFAYVWLIIILLANSPDQVDLWESLATFAMFPLLVAAAYIADKKVLRRGCRSKRRSENSALVKELEARAGKPLPAETVRILNDLAEKVSRPKTSSRAEIRKLVTRSMTGGGSMAISVRFKRSVTSNLANRLRRMGTSEGCDQRKADFVFGFKEDKYVVLECCGAFPVTVVSNRATGRVVEVKYSTVDGTAKAGKRFEQMQGTLIFGPTQTEKTIRIPIIDNDTWDPDEEFYIQLEDLQVKGLSTFSLTNRNSRLSSQTTPGSSRAQKLESSDGHFALGAKCATITVLNDDDAGTLSFDADEVQAHEGTTATICVTRTAGSHGRISCHYETVNGSAVAGQDFEAVSGILEFEDGEKQKSINIPILVSDNHEYETDESFKVVLSQASPGVTFNSNCFGGRDSAVCDVVIAADTQPPYCVKLLRRQFNRDRINLGLSQWSEQFYGAFYCNGSPEEQAEAGLVDWFFHALMLIWKLLFSVVPPPLFLGGWACFWAALGLIGVVTALVGDAASLLGCCLGIPDEITAITLVALGTSLPDTLASKTAAQQEDTADNSIGNIMGSNSVNVFLGLGISWTIGVVYWKVTGATPEWRQRTFGVGGKTYEELFMQPDGSGTFVVPAGTLLFSVIVYTCCALACIALFALRRWLYGGELGGPKRAQRRDSFLLFFIWCVYIAIVSTYSALQ